MSSCSSEDNVQSVPSDTLYEEVQKAIQDLGRHCQVIQDTVQNLDNKFTAINRKVSKLYYYCAKPTWQNRRRLGYSYKHHHYLLSRKTKWQKRKKEDPPLPASLSGSECYSPTSPVRRPTPNPQENPAGTYYQSQDSQLWDHESLEEQDIRLSQNPILRPFCTVPYPSCLPRYTCSGPTPNPQESPAGTYYQSQDSQLWDHESFEEQDIRLSQNPILRPFCTVPYPSCLPRYTCSGPDADPVQGTSSMHCWASPVAHSMTSGLSAVQASTLAPAAMLDQGISHPAHNPEVLAYPPLLESERLDHAASTLHNTADCGASSAAETHSDMPGKVLSADPSTWSVEEVILFLKQRDPQTLTPVADVFRQHDIDGKAMIMHQLDNMIEDMGLKLGPALKLCDCIEKLREEKCIDL
ncbi:sex comb on midleg-like protein 1 [Saccopteryx leptura]|uniref:sex comb on midleg-like protein 1 n=1 Tax=Saccopteryx leptura TaxID=249018 RepID=UPI00339BAF0F